MYNLIVSPSTKTWLGELYAPLNYASVAGWARQAVRKLTSARPPGLLKRFTDSESMLRTKKKVKGMTTKRCCHSPLPAGLFKTFY